ncbi:hypothetical protein [Methanobrevibacter sp.]|uniref:hypothetical protein n=1 Tax=Methanobrevibacter sp. TaxID=66852 RepID=UPI0038642C4D
MMIDPKTFRKSLENESLDTIIKERDKLIREIRRFEKNKIPQEDYTMDPSPEVIYLCNQEYLAELCYLINEKRRKLDKF